MRSIGRLGAIAAALVLTLAFAACGGDEGDGGATGSTPPTGATESIPTGDGGSLSVTIRGSNFDPGELEVPAGSVTVSVTNEDAIAHTFTTDDMVVNEQVGAGGTVEVTVDLTEDLGWHCEIHPSMRGKFVVS
jgi:plastocyanin